MMSTKAIARNTWIIILVIIIAGAAIIGGVTWYYYNPPAPALKVPDFVKNNIVVLEGGNSPQWLDPHVSYYQYDYWITMHTAETLLWYNGTSSTDVIPWLAESYTKNTAGTVYTFKLRQGINFQDGTPLNSTAVWFSFNRLLMMDGTDGSGNHGSQAAWIIQQLLNTSLSASLGGEDAIHFDSTLDDFNYTATWVKAVLDQKFVEIIDNYNFKLNILNPTTQTPYLLSQVWAAILSPSSVIKKDYQYGNWGTWNGNYTSYFLLRGGNGDTYYNVPEQGWKFGTGPYYFDSYNPSTYRVVLKVNPNYWGGPTNFQYPIGQPKIKEIDFNYVESFTTRLLDLKGGLATGIGVSEADIYSVADKDTWLTTREFKSLIDGVTTHGPFNQLVTDWFNFIWNVTDPVTRQLRSFQPTADRRIRLAIASAVNMTDINLYVNNGLGELVNNLIPPGTAPNGAYNPNIKPPWSFNLTRAAELILDARDHPLTQFTYYNGTSVPSGIINNSFGPTNPKTIDMYVGSADILSQRVLTSIATNLNQIASPPKRGGNDTGLFFSVIPVPGGQQYTLASRHQVYMYWGGWVADYNHVLNWLVPMYLSTGTYFNWNQINIPQLDQLVDEAIDADSAGQTATLLQKNDAANRLANERVLYFYQFHPLAYFTRSAFLKGWYFNVALANEYFAPMHYEETI